VTSSHKHGARGTSVAAGDVDARIADLERRVTALEQPPTPAPPPPDPEPSPPATVSVRSVADLYAALANNERDITLAPGTYSGGIYFDSRFAPRTVPGVIRCDGVTMNGGGLTFPGNDQALAAIRQQVLGQGVDPARVDTWNAGSLACGGSKARGEGGEERGDLAAPETEPVIRHRSRQRVDALDRVEPVHRTTGRTGASAVRETTRVPNHLGVGQKGIGVERVVHPVDTLAGAIFGMLP
jgi:hypothetical protein